MNKRIFALLLCLIMVVSILPVQAFANEADEGLEFVEDTYASPDDGTDPEELFTQYASSVFWGSDASSNEAMAGTLAGKQLSGNEYIAYKHLVTLFKQVANGQRASSKITIGQPVTNNGVTYPVDINTTFQDRYWSQSSYDSSTGKVVDALLADLPFEQYWYDKTIGVRVSWWWNNKVMLQMTFEFVTAEHVRAGNDQFTVNTAKTSAPLKAAANAKAIAAAAEGKSDYEKLVYFRDQVASLTEYNWDAVEAGWSYHENNNPWQLIWCFDGDPSTNVVCEGYAKSFMYLCDLTTFRNNITCTTVTGDMWFPGGGGGHMWNIVSIEGKNYIVDVTNSDSGSKGNDTYFLDGGTGSVLGGYYFNGNSSVTYEYHDDMFVLWGYGSDSILNLSSTNFNPSSISSEPAAPGIPDSSVVRIYGNTRYETCTQIADALKQVRGVDKFDAVIIASGTNFADALAGSHLAAEKGAPILLCSGKNMTTLKRYIRANVNSGGTVYILGGVNAVPKSMETDLDGYNVKRLAGGDRYATNLAILNETGVKNQVIVCTGTDFADSLSASSIGAPILLVSKKGLTNGQKEYLASVTGSIFIVGGKNAVSETLEAQLKSYGNVVRIAGATRYETSLKLAEATDYGVDPQHIVVAYAKNFPDGLCGGPLANALGCPLFLVSDGKGAVPADNYTDAMGIIAGYVLGGPKLISDATIKTIFD